MTALRTIAAVLILAIAVHPVAALGMPCCCQRVEAATQKACCQHHQVAKTAAKPCCAKHLADGPKLRRGCCCSVENAPANLPAQERLAKVSSEQLFSTPALLPTVFAVVPRPERHAAPLLFSAASPSVNVLHCTWQI